jgi:hypothetical protein
MVSVAGLSFDLALEGYYQVTVFRIRPMPMQTLKVK